MLDAPASVPWTDAAMPSLNDVAAGASAICANTDREPIWTAWH